MAALNGVLGDYLVAAGNPLAISMHVRVAGAPVILDRSALAAAFPNAGRNVVVLVHGLCMNDLQWKRESHDHGAALARDLGYTPVYLHYNTGRHIAENGREFAALMEELVGELAACRSTACPSSDTAWAVSSREARFTMRVAGHAWPKRLHDLVFLGTPHFGANLERAGARADFLLGISPYTAPLARLGKLRSAGIKDLRHGYLRDDAGLRIPDRAAARRTRCRSRRVLRATRSPPVGSNAPQRDALSAAMDWSP